MPFSKSNFHNYSSAPYRRIWRTFMVLMFFFYLGTYNNKLADAAKR